MSYRYLGNKTRIADWITGIVSRTITSGATIADLMCGTASMSAAFAAAGYRVIAADTLRFPVLHAQARLFDNTPNHFRTFGLDYESAIATLNALQPINGLFQREYSEGGRPLNGVKPRKYFTSDNASRIDAIRAAIRNWRAQGLDGLATDLLLHDLILATNRIANIAGTYGYYRADFGASSRARLTLKPTDASHSGIGHQVVQGTAHTVVSRICAEAVYLDPPYTKRQYGGNYHILETLAREDDPIPAGKGGLRDWAEQASDFCYRRHAERGFRQILDGCRARWVFVSYSEDGHLSGTELGAILASYGRVELHERALGRFRSNERVARQGFVREHLYVVEMANACATEPGGNLVAEAESQRSI